MLILKAEIEIRLLARFSERGRTVNVVQGCHLEDVGLEGVQLGAYFVAGDRVGKVIPSGARRCRSHL